MTRYLTIGGSFSFHLSRFLQNALEQYGHIVANPSEPFIIACQNAKPPLIEFIKPMHESKEKRREIENAVVWGKFVPNKAEINQIRDYFGINL